VNNLPISFIIIIGFLLSVKMADKTDLNNLRGLASWRFHPGNVVVVTDQSGYSQN
jgi:hypothetical protein